MIHFSALWRLKRLPINRNRLIRFVWKKKVNISRPVCIRLSPYYIFSLLNEKLQTIWNINNNKTKSAIFRKKRAIRAAILNFISLKKVIRRSNHYETWIINKIIKINIFCKLQSDYMLLLKTTETILGLFMFSRNNLFKTIIF